MKTSTRIQTGSIIGRVGHYVDHSDTKKHGLKGRQVRCIVRGLSVKTETGEFRVLVEECNAFGHGSGGAILTCPLHHFYFDPVDR